MICFPVGTVFGRDMATLSFMATPHDHQSCVDAAIEGAARLCGEKSLRFTQICSHVLELVWGCHTPIRAYDILEGLRLGYPRAAPPTVYRALDFLTGLGIIHRIESMNAFVGCNNPEHLHAGQFLIFGDCGTTAEWDDSGIKNVVRRGTGRLGFVVQQQAVEVTGLCPDCQAARPN
jgi:Fur family zinc uptake transcriptional regulator